MNKIIKDYLPRVEKMGVEESSKEFRSKWGSQLGVLDVEALVLLRYFWIG